MRSGRADLRPKRTDFRPEQADLSYLKRETKKERKRRR